MENPDFLRCAPLTSAQFPSTPLKLEEILKAGDSILPGKGQAVAIAGVMGIGCYIQTYCRLQNTYFVPGTKDEAPCIPYLIFRLSTT